MGAEQCDLSRFNCNYYHDNSKESGISVPPCIPGYFDAVFNETDHGHGVYVCYSVRGADLSGGRMLGAAAVLAGSLAQMSTYANKFFPNLAELPIIVPIIACLLMGMAMGLLNGIVVAKLNVPAFIGTLGVQLIIYGGISIYYNMEPNRSQPLGGF